MSVRPTKNRKGEIVQGCWEIDYYPPGGKGKRERLRFYGSESSARLAEQSLRRKNKPSTNPSMASVLPEYLEWHQLHRAPKTTKDVILSWKWLSPIFGHLPVSHITPATIMQYKGSRAGRSPRTINKELDYLKALISWMVRQGYANVLPFKVEKMPHKKRLPSIPTHAKVMRFIASLRPPVKPMALLMYYAGMRSDEVKNLRWENVGKDTVTIRTSKGEQRLALWPEEVDRRLERKKSGLIFPSPKSKGEEQPYVNVLRSFASASERSGVKITPHLLRHCLGTNMLEATGDLRLVQQTLGHKDITTTTIYTHITAQRMQAGLTAMRASQRASRKDQSATSQSVKKKGLRKKP